MNQLAVAGLGRCGTSLVMQMLDAGGVPIWNPFPPSYEPDELMPLYESGSWEKTEGKAINLNCSDE